MKIIAFTCLITVLVSLVQAQSSLFALEQPIAFISLCDCWANPGAQSLVAFYTYDPSSQSDNQPNFTAVLLTDTNYPFEAGGMAAPNFNSTTRFIWLINNSSAPPDTLVGHGTWGNDSYISHYDIYKSKKELLFSTSISSTDFQCFDIYHARISNVNTESATSTSTNTSILTSNSASNTGLPVGAKISIGIGSSIAVLMFLTLLVLFLRRVWQRRITDVIEDTPIEMDCGRKRAELSRSTTVGSWSTPVSALSELHPDAAMEMADTNYRLMYRRLPSYPSPVYPMELCTERHYTLYHQ